MADTLYMNDGSIYPILTEDDFRNLLRDRLGDNVEKYFLGCLEEQETNIAELELEVQSFECTADGYLSMLNNVKEELEAIMDMCRDKTTKKTQILKAIKTAWADLNNNL